MADPHENRVFLSAVSSEFEMARNEIANDLQSRENLLIRIQRSFRQEEGADTLLRLLHNYIAECKTVVCVMGARSGAFPPANAAQAFAHILPAGFTEASYTQWEFLFAHHFNRRLLIYLARADYKPDRGPSPTDRPDSQKAFLKFVRETGRPYTPFSDYQELCRLVLREDWPPKVQSRPRNLPFASLGPLFKGRETFLTQLHDSLRKKQGGSAAAVTGKALHGLGGIGKTRLAIEYAWKYAQEYSALLFVPAESPERLEAGLAALAGVLDLPEKDAREDEVKIAAVRKWLDAHKDWLLILDNVDNAQAAAATEELVASLAGGHVLITGRTSDFSPAIETFPLDVLKEDDAAALLLESTARRAKAPNDDALAHELARAVDGLALALAQAGAYINKQRIDFARYLGLWREKRAVVVNWFDKRLVGTNHDAGLAATWMTSVEQLTPGGRRLLELLAFLAPEPVPDSLLDVPVPGGASDFDARDALTDLFAYSLATRVGATGEPAFAIHRLVQEFTRETLDEAKRKDVLTEALGRVDAAFDGDPGDVRSWPVFVPLAPHALAIADQAYVAGIPDPTARLLSQLGLLFKTKSRFAEAEPLYRRALEIDEKSFAPDHPNVAADLNTLAQLLSDTNRLSEAEPLMRRALAIDETSFGPDHPRIAVQLNNLAGLLRATNRLAEAEPMHRRALEIDEKSFGPEHPAVARDLNNLALLLKVTNRLAEAEPMYRRALEIDEKSLGPEHPIVASRLNNLAQLFEATNRLAEAEPLMRRALAIDEKTLGPDHPNVATGLNNLAALLWGTNRLAEAEPLMRRALAIDEKSFGPELPNVARDLNNLAQLLQDTNRLADAEPLMRRALAIDEKSLGLDHPNVATHLNNLAQLFQATNRLAEAEPLMRRALAIVEKSFGPEHPRVAVSLSNLAELLRATKRLTEAEPLMRRNVGIFLSFTAQTGHEHPHLQAAFGNYFGLLRAMGRSEAEARAAIEAVMRAHGLTPR